MVIAYLDNILIYIVENLEEYIKKVKKVLKILKRNNIILNLDKYKFYQKKVIFLETIISRKDLKMNSEKI